jgi:hypothetical protein
VRVLISQLLGSGRTYMFLVSILETSQILTASQVNDFSISLWFLCGIPFAVPRG